MKLKKGDEVKIVIGKDRGKTGKIEKVFPKKGKIIVSGLNLYKRHLKSRGPGKPGGIIDIIKPIPIANVALICPKCKKQTRVGYKTSLFSGENKMFSGENKIEGAVKSRICRKCQGVI